MSILSYPDRGAWGNASWRGNCSGFIYRDLFRMIKPRLFVDPMCGSGTSLEVAQEMRIEAIGLDLHSGFNILRNSILAATGRPADLVVSHPPYGGMIVYSGEVWGTEAHPDDLSRCTDDEDFHTKLQMALLNQREATLPGGIYGTIIGDWRRQGRYTSYQAEAIARMPKDELLSVIIKVQHNTRSGSRSYQALRVPLIEHEYILLWMKPRSTQVHLLSSLAVQQHTRLRNTWRVVVRLALVSLGGSGCLGDLYAKVAEHAPDRLATNNHWQAKIRQVLQRYTDFSAIDRGVWSLC